MRKLVFSLMLVVFCATPVLAQRGDKKGEVQIARVPAEKIPPAPPRSAEEELKTFKLPPGFHMELVASDPLVEMPIAMQFDPDGRIYVVEMRGFMPNVDAIGEKEPVGRVSVLEDTDGDGRVDKRTTFLDGLVMPRALSLVRGGVLVAEPPHLWFCRDTNGDLKCDTKIEVTSDYGSQANPEHTANGLLWARDNWIYSANWNYRLRNTTGIWQKELTTVRGQFGITQDDFGRLFHNSNSDQLRGDLIPSRYALRRSAGAKVPGLNERIAKDQSAWPSRVNPGVNRGYQPKQLRADGTLATVTAACSPCIYRGENFPAEFYGNAFVCEPSGNLVKRNVLAESDGLITAKNPYDKADFLTSTDERFRPVNLCTGPDGALYVVDMYHGILQHRIFVTSYLRQQILSRRLETPQNQGRIWRVVYDKTPRRNGLKLADASSAGLVNFLSHTNGFVRDTAQRLLVERADSSVVPTLQALVINATPLARLHALWTLEGMNRLDANTIANAMSDSHPKIRATAVRLSESLLRVNSSSASELRKKLVALRTDKSADVQIQLALTLGEVPDNAEAKAVLAALSRSPFALARDAAKFSLAPRQSSNASQVVARKGPPLPPETQKRFDAGKATYEATCMACHQPHGLGQEGLAPPLAGSEWVAGNDQRLARIVLHGLRGPLKVKGQKYELDMPALGVLEDQQIADILTYVRREWGHDFPPVLVDTVAKIRAQFSAREDAWTQEELLKVR